MGVFLIPHTMSTRRIFSVSANAIQRGVTDDTGIVENLLKSLPFEYFSGSRAFESRWTHQGFQGVTMKNRSPFPCLIALAVSLAARLPSRGLRSVDVFEKQAKNLHDISHEKKRRWNANSGADSLWGRTSNTFKKIRSVAVPVEWKELLLGYVQRS